MRLDHLLSKEEEVGAICVSLLSYQGRSFSNDMIPAPMRPGATPVPIPNTTVKPRAADGTALETMWESRRVPDQKK